MGTPPASIIEGRAVSIGGPPSPGPGPSTPSTSVIYISGPNQCRKIHIVRHTVSGVGRLPGIL